MNEIRSHKLEYQGFVDCARAIRSEARNVTAHSYGDDKSLHEDYKLSIECLASLKRLFTDYYPHVRKDLERKIDEYNGMKFDEYAVKVGFEDELADTFSLASMAGSLAASERSIKGQSGFTSLKNKIKSKDRGLPNFESFLRFSLGREEIVVSYFEQ